MAISWQAAAVFVGLTGLPHPDHLQGSATWLMSLGHNNTNLPHPDQLGEQVTPGQIMLCVLLARVLVIVMNILCMVMYKQNVHDHKPQIKPDNQTMRDGNFHHGMFGCFSNCNECMCAFVCPTIRFADTHSSVTDTGFWKSFWLFIFGNLLTQFAIAEIVAMVLPAPPFSPDRNANIVLVLVNICRALMWGVWSRGKLRTKLGDPNPSQGQGHDFVSWCLCPFLALTQESVEADIAADVVISCPWNLKVGRQANTGRSVEGREVLPSDYQRMVGDAVLLDGQ